MSAATRRRRIIGLRAWGRGDSIRSKSICGSIITWSASFACFGSLASSPRR